MTPRPLDARIRSEVRELRTKAGLTQEELAQQVGVTRVTINCLERGVYSPSLELAFRLAKFFKRPIEDVFSMEER